MINKKTTILLLILFGAIILYGCDNLKCRPDGKVDKEGNPTYVGFKCGGKF